MNAQAPRYDLRPRIEQVDSLPALPHIAERLLELQRKKAPGARDLAAIIELDPALASQVLRHAASPLLGCREKILSINEAVTRLGFDNVLNMALGFTASQGLSIPGDGPIGLQAFWRHAVYTAALMQRMAQTLTRSTDANPGLAYLAGLLHNIGFLLLGHLFPTEFSVLNQLVENRPDEPVTALEHKHLGMDHTESGALLMRKWRMPPEIVTTVFAHHNPDYRGEQHQYANLAFLADALMKAHGLGDAASRGLPDKLLHSLGFREEQVMALNDEVMANAKDLEAMAENLTQASGR